MICNTLREAQKRLNLSDSTMALFKLPRKKFEIVWADTVATQRRLNTSAFVGIYEPGETIQEQNA